MTEPKKTAADAPKGERLQKILAQAGIASRRKAEEVILEGRVQVNGTVVTELGTRAELGRDHIRVDGKLLQGREEQRYYLVNKPRGYVTTLNDPQHRPTVMDLMLQKQGPHGDRVRLYPVGRLDYLSEGLLLMTNDGELANSLSKAAAGVEKVYLVKIAGVPTPESLEQIRRGIMIDRGRLNEVRAGRRDRVLTAPAKVELVRGGDNPWFEVTLTEGRNRQLRKMFEEVGHHVEKIRRIGYGALRLDVPPGEYRELEAGRGDGAGPRGQGQEGRAEEGAAGVCHAEGSGEGEEKVWTQAGSWLTGAPQQASGVGRALWRARALASSAQLFPMCSALFAKPGRSAQRKRKRCDIKRHQSRGARSPLEADVERTASRAAWLIEDFIFAKPNRLFEGMIEQFAGSLSVESFHLKADASDEVRDLPLEPNDILVAEEGL